MYTDGTFLDVAGLSYRARSSTGVTSSTFQYSYVSGEKVTFAIGGVELGCSLGKPLTTLLDLVPGDTATFAPALVNRARLLFSLSPGQGFERPILIDADVEKAVNKYASEINLDSDQLSDLDKPLRKICTELKVLPKSVSHTRNHLRRQAAGFKVLRDLKIPTTDGGYVLSDVYLPLQPKARFPVLVSCTIYGRRVPWGGPDVEDEQDILRFEAAEDEWHSTPPGTDLQLSDLGPWSQGFKTQRGFESIASLNTFSYVPHGYAMVKIDPRGVSQTPGARWTPGQLATDFATVVEWSVDQDWSNGKVGLVGSSYGANTQWAVASLKPKGLKCFVPYATDIDSYREAAYIGGIPSTKYLQNWFARVSGVSPKWKDFMDVEALMRTNPNYNALWAALGSKAEDSVDVPCFVAASQIFMIHGRGAYEAWMVRRPDNTYLQLVDCDYYSWASRESAAKILQFLDHHLMTPDIPAPEHVGIQVRLGNQSWYWRKERDWPVPGTQYIKWYLTTDQRLTMSPLTRDGLEKKFPYPARSQRKEKSGVSFHSPPFENHVDMAGHFIAKLHISSTAPDADVAVILWAVDENGRVVAYGAQGEPEPLAKGFLRVSHRKTDPSRSLPSRPWHTHSEEDVAILRGPDDVAEIDVEILPAAARISKGWSLRLDILPSEDQPDIAGYVAPLMRLWYGENYDGDAIDTINVGGDRVNYIVCPVVPTMDNYPKSMT